MKKKQIDALLTHHVNETVELLTKELLENLQADNFRSRLDNRNNVILTFSIKGFSINTVRITIDYRAGRYIVQFEYSDDGLIEIVCFWTATKDNLKSIIHKTKYFENHG